MHPYVVLRLVGGHLRLSVAGHGAGHRRPDRPHLREYLSTLTGIAFLFHQVGSFLGVWIAAWLFDSTGG